MPRARRHIEEGGFYEIVFRAREGTPLPSNSYMNLILRSELARANRGERVQLCHFVFMSNHAHILVRITGKGAFNSFHQELKWRITRSVKAVLGLRYLQLWEGRSTVIRLLDFDAALERIRYVYLNPIAAGISESISSYPGINSWQHFQKAIKTTSKRAMEKVLHIRTSQLCPKGNMNTTRYYQIAKSLSIGTQKLAIEPNAWFKSFGITCPQEINRINKSIVDSILKIEEQRQIEWRKKGIKPKSLSAHERESPTVSGNKPKKKERKIYFIGSTVEIRIEFLARFRAFCDTCKDLYEKIRIRDETLNWPCEAFIPAAPP